MVARAVEKGGNLVEKPDPDARPPGLAPENSVCLNLFGGPFVVADGLRLEVPEGGKRLLAYVALLGHPVERRQAAGTLWPDGDDVRAAGNLRSALWRLKGAGIDVIVADRFCLNLRSDVVVDVATVRGWARRLTEGTPTDADLCAYGWRSEFLDLLPGWYEDWALFERERIRQQLLHALEALSRWLLDHGRAAEAIEAAVTAVLVEPLRESAQRRLFEAHIAEGNLVEGLRTYHAYRDLLRRELGAQPGSSFTEVVSAIMAAQEFSASGSRKPRSPRWSVPARASLAR
jgi:DNA-binding SARP family transcriptional activator